MIVRIIAGLVVQKLEEHSNSFEAMKEIEKIISRLYGVETIVARMDRLTK